MYTISVDAKQRVVQVVLGGMLTVAEVEVYMRDLRHALIKAAIGSNYGIVIDVSSCGIQTQDMIQAMGMHMATMPRARSIAIVSVSALARMQVRRLFQQDYARVVSTLDEGLAWVLHNHEPALDQPANFQGAGA